jgi:hypothetical protein
MKGVVVLFSRRADASDAAREPILIAHNEVGSVAPGNKPKKPKCFTVTLYSRPSKFVTEREDEMIRFETLTLATKLTVGRG